MPESLWPQRSRLDGALGTMADIIQSYSVPRDGKKDAVDASAATVEYLWQLICLTHNLLKIWRRANRAGAS